MRALFKMAYGGVITEKEDIEVIRSVLSSLWEFVNNDLCAK